MKAQNADVYAKLESQGINTKAFFDSAFANYKLNLGTIGTALGTANSELVGSLIKQGATINDLIGLQGLVGKEFADAANKILARLKGIEAKPKPNPVIPVGQPGANPLQGFGPNGDGSLVPKDASHGGGPIGPGMVSNRLGKSIRGPIGSDERFILAQDGEYMISAAAAGIIGRNNLDAINNGKLPAVPVSGGSSESSNVFNVYASPGQDAKQIAQEVHRIFQINERRKGGART